MINLADFKVGDRVVWTHNNNATGTVHEIYGRVLIKFDKPGNTLHEAGIIFTSKVGRYFFMDKCGYANKCAAHCESIGCLQIIERTNIISIYDELQNLLSQ